MFASQPMMSPGNGFFNVLFYSAGVLCRKRGWFKHPIPPSLLHPSLAYFVVFWVLFIVGGILLFAPGMPGLNIDPEWKFLGFVAASMLIGGPYACTAAVCLFSLFSRGCKCKNAFLSFLGGGAFAVYLLHYWAITFTMYSFVGYLRQVQDIDVTYGNTTWLRSTASNSEIGIGNVYLGFFYVCIASLVVAFLVGGVLKKIPVLGDVL